MKIKEILWLAFIATTSAILGTIYSVYNTDPHHWGFIAGTALDFIHGKNFFSEIYIQYGIGESILFRFLNNLITINYTSIGVITSIAYALNLIVIYKCLKHVANTGISTLFITIIFLLHPFAIYPWPDYWAGLSLSLACLFLLKEKFIFTGALLFAAFLFRNTYGISILAAGISYLISCIFNKNIRNNMIFKSLVVFTALSCFYFLWLGSNHTLLASYQQSIGASSSQYGVGFESVVILLKRVFLPAKFWLPNNQVNTTISLLFLTSIYTLYLLLFKAPEFKSEYKGTAVFMTLLGLAGISQALHGYEIFRIQNACSPLYFTLMVFVLMKFHPMEERVKEKKYKFVFGLYLLLLLIKFPHASTLFPLFDGKPDEYTSSSVPFFKGHRFRREENKYYDNLYQFMCDGHSKIVNRTLDGTIPYLCPHQENAHALPVFNEFMLSMVMPEKIAEEARGEFKNDEIIVTEIPVTGLPLPTHPKVKLILIGKVDRPESIRFFGKNVISVYKVENI